MSEGQAVVVGQDLSIVFRRYQPSDYDQVVALWSRINRELAPAGMEKLFEQYIATTISGELVRLSEVFSEANNKAFGVVDGHGGIVGCFRIESHSETDTELRRMYLDREFRGTGVAKRMLERAGTLARLPQDARKHRRDSKSGGPLLPQQRVSPSTSGGCPGHDRQAGWRRADAILLREAAVGSQLGKCTE